MLIALICLYIHLYPDASVLSLQNICPSSAVYRDLLGMALPLTANRIVLNILQSIEAVSIPQKLLLYGYDTTTALSVYGVLTGMAMPMIFFPNALTSSVAVLLLPTISENHAKGDREAVWNDTLRTVKYCSLMGFLCLCGFLFLGDWMGTELFHSELAGHFIVTLGFICPFLYLDTTLSSTIRTAEVKWQPGRYATVNSLQSPRPLISPATPLTGGIRKKKERQCCGISSRRKSPAI